METWLLRYGLSLTVNEKDGVGGNQSRSPQWKHDCVRIVGTHLEGEWDEKLR